MSVMCTTVRQGERVNVSYVHTGGPWAGLGVLFFPFHCWSVLPAQVRTININVSYAERWALSRVGPLLLNSRFTVGGQINLSCSSPFCSKPALNPVGRSPSCYSRFTVG